MYYFLKSLFFLFVLMISPAISFAQSETTDNRPITCGNYRTIYSKVLGENRTLLVHLPGDYGTSDKKYPVFYKLDGDKGVFLQTFSAVFYLVDMTDKIPDHIIVGIENTNRGRDMGQGADNFIQFIKDELLPFIEKNYRTNDFRILCGQSASSVFTMYAFLKQSELFNGYILSSFGLQHRAAMASLFDKELKKSPSLRNLETKYLYITNGKLDGYDPNGSRTATGIQFLDTLKQVVPATVLIQYKVYEDEGHVPFPSIYDGLKWIYSNEKNLTK